MDFTSSCHSREQAPKLSPFDCILVTFEELATSARRQVDLSKQQQRRTTLASTHVHATSNNVSVQALFRLPEIEALSVHLHFEDPTFERLGKQQEGSDNLTFPPEPHPVRLLSLVWKLDTG